MCLSNKQFLMSFYTMDAYNDTCPLSLSGVVMYVMTPEGNGLNYRNSLESTYLFLNNL